MIRDVRDESGARVVPKMAREKKFKKGEKMFTRAKFTNRSYSKQEWTAS